MASSLNILSRAKMHDGNSIPFFGLGVYQARPGDSATNAVKMAIEAGYRHVDTAALYGNEADVGQAIRESGVPRDQIFVTTKLWDSNQGYESTKKAFEKSFKNLGLDYVDLYLIHSPNPGKKARLESWKAMEELVASGKVKSIGVSNYGVHHLKELIDSNPKILPTVNQVELHPWLTRSDIAKFCQENGIVVEAYSPLTKGEKLGDATLLKIAKKHSKTPAQILIRWSLQHNYVVIPKSVTKDRIISNSEVYNFSLDNDDMKTLDALDEYYITGWDPTKSA